MKRWLIKSEPDVYSIDDLERDGRTYWDGIRSYASRLFLREMEVGDLCFFYHSNADPSAIVGVARVVAAATPDPTQFEPGDAMRYDPRSTREDPRWVGVEVAFVERLPRAVTLADVKGAPALKAMKLLKVSRLSVSPVTAAEWKGVLALSRKLPRKAQARSKG